ncbi:chemotaxis partial : Globin-coupled methyl-accepting chemotaxis protein (Modular protein) OS=Candidatus Nitrospira defluvii GN=cheM PE=3 SV=1: 4HB_MCP_1: HAMP: PAS_9: MCPsignal [Gemmata massiliana]|uniref:Uncharacterized protein n=1 Tax=Gemmata massiliana TaxID=1210884 RepID=A0A6P2CST7_9BACT|nr:methyl-accepting chemotaxis protein [Gemmata massiliana]VTR91999.1 chemotaxis partial : Globin-coupled methyl-accepting chemotaxis protein (Modular protein) OS=Candidatus Nitrospira defluvii GN=cheM PE=3 SV=1: 4HB_MCP_1: HAMP: PAS_9: MCPsignal [Gemmata massiliana]
MLDKLIVLCSHVRIGPRLGIVFVLLLGICGAIGYQGIHALYESNKAVENANAELLPSLRNLAMVRNGIVTVQRTERSLILATLSKDEETRAQAPAAQAAAWAATRDGVKGYEALSMNERERAIWTQFKPALEEYQRANEGIMGALASGDAARAEKLCVSSRAVASRVTGLIGQLIDLQEETGKAEATASREKYAAARTALMSYVAGALVLSAVLGTLLTLSIVRPLNTTRAVLENVAKGDLTKRAEVDSRDEVGQMAAALNVSIAALRLAHEKDADFASQMAAVNKVQAVIEFKMDGTIVHANENFLRTVGYSLSEIQGRHHSMFVEPAYASSPEYREFWSRLNRGEYVADEFKRFGRGGKEVWIQASYNPIFDTSGKPYKVVKYATDITAAKNLEFQVKASAEQERAHAAELQRKVVAITTSVSALAVGDFTQQIPDLGTDEVGHMASALNRAVVSVRTALEGVREVSEQLADASTQLSATSEEISTGAEEQASSLEETASALEEITATVGQNSDSAQQARQLASSSRDVAEKGGQVVGNAVEAMSEINQSSKKIADIITTIDEIAFQTNLLALNAAVEAARAGEQGRGFAVVASEVRNLAQRSATSAKEIKALIEDSVKKVDAGTELVNQSGTTLGEIVTSVKRVTDIITEIAAAGKEQSVGIEQVNKAVAQMDAVTQKNASQTEEMSATAQSLTDQAAQLRDLVARFKLSEEGRTASRPAARSRRPATKPRPAVAKALKSGHSNGHGRKHELDQLGGDGGFTEF